MKKFKYPISFILPTYNVEPYLAECLDSILRQSIEKEIIIVNDGSTDNSLSIALDYAKRYPNIVVLHSQNKGVSAARNLGLRAAQGEFVIWLDPDDKLNDKIQFETIYQLAKQTNSPVIKGQFDTVIQYNGKRYHNRPTHQNVINDNAVITDLISFYENALSTSWFIQIAAFMFQKSFLEKNNLKFEESLSIGEDGLFNIDLFCCDGKILEVPYCFFHYRIHKESTMGTPVQAKRLYAVMHSLELIKERLSSTSVPKLKYLIEATLALYSYFLHRDINLASPEVKKEFEHIITPELVHFYQKWGINTSEKIPYSH